MQGTAREVFPDPEEREFLAEVIEAATGEAEQTLALLKEQPFIEPTTEESFAGDIEDYANMIGRAKRELAFLQRLSKWFGGDT